MLLFFCFNDICLCGCSDALWMAKNADPHSSAVQQHPDATVRGNAVLEWCTGLRNAWGHKGDPSVWAQRKHLFTHPFLVWDITWCVVQETHPLPYEGHSALWDRRDLAHHYQNEIWCSQSDLNPPLGLGEAEQNAVMLLFWQVLGIGTPNLPFWAMLNCIQKTDLQPWLLCKGATPAHRVDQHIRCITLFCVHLLCSIMNGNGPKILCVAPNPGYFHKVEPVLHKWFPQTFFWKHAGSLCMAVEPSKDSCI
jgi:hypothetical protein